MRWDDVIARIPAGQPCLGAEIGVWRGDLSEKLMAARPLLELALVDVWTADSQGVRLTRLCPPREAREQVSQLCARYQNRCFIMQRLSVEAARAFADGSLDFVFIDARHDYRSVRDDIAAWTPKIKIGGWVGGHDYAPETYPGVVRAVEEAFGEAELGSDYTWFVRR